MTTNTKTKIQNEALDVLLQYKQAGVEISMGVGKTLLGLRHMEQMVKSMSKPKRFLVAASKRAIFESWKAEAIENNLHDLLNLIDFTTYRSLSKQKPIYDTVYLDECHNLKYSHQLFLSSCVSNDVKIVGLTGTYPKFKKGEKGEMCNQFCPKVYEYKTDEAVEDKILNDYRIYVHRIPLSDKKVLPMKGKNGSQWFVSERQNYEYWCLKLYSVEGAKEIQMLRILRMKAMMSYPSKEEYVMKLLARRKTKTIVFANTQEQADRIAPNSYHSSNPRSEENLNKFKSGEIDLLSAVEQLSEGVNIPNLKSGIIMHSYSNNRKAAQKIGRLLRLNPNDTSGIHILCYKDTIDENWVNSALESFDQDKIVWLD